MSSPLPLDAQVQAAQIEDALSVWQRRSMTSYRPQAADRAERVLQLCTELIETFDQLRDRVYDELVDYERTCATGCDRVAADQSLLMRTET